MRYINDSDETRIWPGIQTVAGQTLELKPGEDAELELPEDFEDVYLKPAGLNRVVQRSTTVELQKESQR